MNPLLAGLQNNPISRAIQMARNIRNPQGMLQEMINKDADLKASLDMAQGDYQKAFQIYAQRKGVNPNDVLSQMR